jgi:hypothetical protein
MILYFFFASFAPVRCFVTYISLSAPSWPPPSLAVYHSNLVKLPDLQSQQKTRSPWIRLSRPPFLLSLLLGEYYKWSGFEAGANLFWRMKLMKSPQKNKFPGCSDHQGSPPRAQNGLARALLRLLLRALQFHDQPLNLRLHTGHHYREQVMTYITCAQQCYRML